MAETLHSFDDQFSEGQLNESIWIGTHLPHWSSRAATKPNYKIANGQLTLFVADQQPWCPEFDGVTRVSNLQSAVTEAKLGDSFGQHRYKTGLKVREQQSSDYRALMLNGRLEIRARVSLTEQSVAALWLLGLEDKPENSGELCLFEIKSENLAENEMLVGMGTKAYFDPRLSTDFTEFRVNNPDEFHMYAVTKTSAGLAFEIDGQTVFSSTQTYDYPLQLMLGVYESSGNLAHQPSMTVDYVRLNELPVEGQG